MNKTNFAILGARSGGGSSMLAMTVLEHLLSHGETPFLIDVGRTGSNAWRAYGKIVPGRQVDIELLGAGQAQEAIGGSLDNALVVHARSGCGATAAGLGDILAALPGQLCVFWVIDREPRSLENLGELVDAVAHYHGTKVHVVRDLECGRAEEFHAYNSSELRNKIEYAGGKSLNLPDVAFRVTDALQVNGWTLSAAARELPFGNRIELLRWQRECGDMLAEVVR
jgi:hypothetical protein